MKDERLAKDIAECIERDEDEEDEIKRKKGGGGTVTFRYERRSEGWICEWEKKYNCWYDAEAGGEICETWWQFNGCYRVY